MERWRNIDGFDGNYLISTFGRVYSKIYGIIRKPFINEFGYVKIQLRGTKGRRNVFVHQLVASAFIRNISALPEVNHIDGNKLNNHFSNLEWTTRGGNLKHAYQQGLRKSKRGAKYLVKRTKSKNE